jgi:VirE N-terminal domain
VRLSKGNNIKDTRTSMSFISLEGMFECIRDGNENMKETTLLLRKVNQYSKEHYRNMKVKLPYVSCSIFEDNIRNYNNFLHAIGWIIDVDSETDLEIGLKEMILKDDRIGIAFRSPNGCGLKMFFFFDEPYNDKINYTNAYKSFSQEFGLKYGILDKIDMKNCDVSRVCFLCHDPECFININYTPIEPHAYIYSKSNLVEVADSDASMEINPDVYKNIMHRLGSKPKPIQSQPLVPYQIYQAIEPIRSVLFDNQIEIVSTEEIQYGIKIFLKYGRDNGEIIVYHGKSGYTVVSSPKKGVHHSLNEIAKQIVETFLYTMPL